MKRTKSHSDARARSQGLPSAAQKAKYTEDISTLHQEVERLERVKWILLQLTVKEKAEVEATFKSKPEGWKETSWKGSQVKWSCEPLADNNDLYLDKIFF